MAIVAGDILKKLSIKTGAAGNSSAQADPNASLGKYISISAAAETLHALFDAITGVENAASDVEYRCIFIHNNHATLTALTTKVYISAETAGGAALAIGVDTTAASAIGSASAQAIEVATEGDAPVGVSFSSPVSEGAALTLGDIPAGQCKALWLRRTAANSVASSNDGATLTIFFDTEA